MFGFRTPAKEARKSPEAVTKSPEKAGPSRETSVRRSIGEWETGKTDHNQQSKSPSSATAPSGPPRLKTKATKTTLSQESGKLPKSHPTIVLESPPQKQVFPNRTAEARACLNKAKLHLGNSRNLKTDIKAEVTQAIERLYALVKEAEAEREKGMGAGKTDKQGQKEETKKDGDRDKDNDKRWAEQQTELIERLEKQSRLIEQNNTKMEQLKEEMGKHTEALGRATYASVAANKPGTQGPVRTALHSVVVSATNEMETGEEVLQRIRKVVKAKDGEVEIERVKKAKDRKVIVGCRTEKERDVLKKKLGCEKEHLKVEDIANKDPLLILKDVFTYNTDEDILKAIRAQNRQLLGEAVEDKIEIAYKKRTRNPHTSHIVLRVSPRIWQKMTQAETARIDLQRVRVADQSPLVQCTICLGYGHGRRLCKESIAICSHCGGPHLVADCADRLTGIEPHCINCVKAKMSKTDHNAFSQECTTRKRWDILARQKIAYC